MKKIFLSIICFVFVSTTFSQVGGTNTYDFLTLSNSPRIVGMGGNFSSIYDGDISLSVANPSLINPMMHNQLSLNFVDYFADINYGFATYSRTWDKLGSFAASVQYIDYGEELETSFLGDTLGTFSGSENAVIIGWGRVLDSVFSIGANLKFISSFLYDYNSFGLGVDLSATYFKENKGFSASVILRNIGKQVFSNVPGDNGRLPFEIQVALSKKLKHVPLRWNFVFANLQKFNLSYFNPNASENKPDPFTGEIKGKKDNFAKKLMRHVIVGVELSPIKRFQLRLGYNYRMRQEMKVENKLGTVGFSWGFGIRISRFQINYSRAAYHLVGSPNYISITTNLN